MTEEELVEKVAGAIAVSNRLRPNDFADAQKTMRGWQVWEQDARAAIAAMREAGWQEPSSERHAFP